MRPMESERVAVKSSSSTKTSKTKSPGSTPSETSLTLHRQQQDGRTLSVVDDEGRLVYRKRNVTSLSKFTEQVREILIENARAGAPIKAAAALAGVHPSTVSKWLKDGGEDEESPFAEFAVQFYAAQAEYKMELLAKIRKIGVDSNQWAALMTILERVYPDEFKKPSEGKNVTVNVGILEQRVHEARERGIAVYDGG